VFFHSLSFILGGIQDSEASLAVNIILIDQSEVSWLEEARYDWIRHRLESHGPIRTQLSNENWA